MINLKYSNAMAEVLHYLKGIRQEGRDKIPKELMSLLEENASKDYECDFDYNKPLKELNLLDETRGLIGMICLNYWCETEEQKARFIDKLNENERKYQEELREKYNPNDLFKKNNIEKDDNVNGELLNQNMQLIEYKRELVIIQIIHRIKEKFKKRFIRKMTVFN